VIAKDLTTTLSLAHKRWPEAGIVKVSNTDDGRSTLTTLLVRTHRAWSINEASAYMTEVKEATRGRVAVSVCR